MATVSRSDFIQQFAGATIDLNHPDPEVMARLEAVGVSAEDLRKIAGQDGIISGRDEAKALYYLVEKHDFNGTYASLEVGKEEGNMSTSTEAGEIYGALMDAVERGRMSRPEAGGQPAPAPVQGTEAPKPPKSEGGEAPRTRIHRQEVGGRTSDAERATAIAHFKDQGFQTVNFTPNTMYFAQGDPGWRRHDYPKSDGSTEPRTLLKSGCGPTALAMVDATLRGTNTSPTAVADYAVEKGLSGKGRSGTYTAELLKAWAKETGLAKGPTMLRTKDTQTAEANLAKIRQTIDEGGMVMIGVDKGSNAEEGHFTKGTHVMVIVGHGKDENDQEWFFIANPGRGTPASSADGAVIVDGAVPHGAGMVRVKKETLLDEMTYAMPVKRPDVS